MINTIILCSPITTIALILVSMITYAQQEHKPFKGYFVNDELEVYLHIDLYEDMNIPEHELFGPLPGYLAKIGRAHV